MAMPVNRILAATAFGLLSACSLAPDYRVPDTAVPAAYKESGVWRQATPAAALPRDAWWRLYRDNVLNDLEIEIEQGNPTLAQAVARYDAARGYLEEIQSAEYPTLTAGGHATTNRQSDNRPLRSASQPTNYGDDLAGGILFWDLDFWGKIRNRTVVGKAEAQASFADLQDIRLSLQAQLADSYVELRGLDAQSALLQNAIGIYAKAFQITTDRHAKGIASGLDIGRAQTQLETAKAQYSDVAARRSLLEHAIASLVGTPASSFTIPEAAAALTLPVVPTGVPSALLQRRPDIAAAERRVAATNAEIGVARAAFYPDISLSGLAGFQNTGNDALFTAPDAYWALGPSLAFTLFDAGRHEGQLAVAKAGNSAAAAAYRSAVLHAFQDVEDNLALLGRLADEASSESKSVAAATRTQKLALSLYQNGALGFLDVVVAQTAALQAQQAALSIETRRLQASVNLIHALGGGWSADDSSLANAETSPGRNTHHM
ncbi:MAG TPA: efflux transporter outer membrane subunit [Rhizomicrobium sp.]|jgi:NodT family efflux transporter outer membrane factor (OMF) lipoprotein